MGAYYEHRWKKERGLCSVRECTRPVVARGMCRPHYDRKRRTGSAVGASDIPLPGCLAPECTRTVDHHNARYCAAHVSRAAVLNDRE